jgi:N6-L-threonylcarbamoyladenine synthase
MIETRDDAFGEVFDKVGKRLGLPYPQGPKVDELAERGTASKVMFRVPVVKDELFFSYSGLKSQALREIEGLERRGVLKKHTAIPYHEPDAIPQPVFDLLASFRHSAVRQLLDRLRRHQDRRSIGTLAVSGGAAANRLLRRELIRWAEEARVNLRLVPLKFSGDNAAMIAYAALVRGRYGRSDDTEHLKVASRIPFS